MLKKTKTGQVNILIVVALVVGLILGILVYPIIIKTTNECVQSLEECEEEIAELNDEIINLEAEIEDLHNQLVELEECDKPDLIIDSISHEPSEPTTQDEITFTVTVKNIGIRNAGESTLSLRVGGETHPETYSVEPLSPNESYEIQRTDVLNIAQYYQITAEADIDDDVEERDENNNRGIHITQVMLEQVPVNIGVLNSGEDMERIILLTELTEQDINDYCVEQGLSYVFDFLIEFSDWQASIALEKVQSFKAMDVNLIVTDECNSGTQAAMSYLNENDMLLLTGRRNHPYFYLSGSESCYDTIFDLNQNKVLAKMLWSYGIEAIAVLQDASPDTDGYFNLFEPEWESLGGITLGRIKVPTMATELSSSLTAASDLLQSGITEYGSDHVAFLLYRPGYLSTFPTQVLDYPTLLSVKWFGTIDVQSNHEVTNLGSYRDQLGIYTPSMTPPTPENRNNIESRYQAQTGHHLGYYGYHLYDACWLYALSVIETESTDPYQIELALPGVAIDYFDGSGWCPLYTADRTTADYDIWGYTTFEDHITSARFGIYDGQSETVTWFAHGMTLFGETTEGANPPGH